MVNFYFDSSVADRLDAQSKARWAARRSKVEQVVRSKDPDATKLRKLVGKVCKLDKEATSEESVYRPRAMPVVDYGEPQPPPAWFTETAVTCNGLPVYTHKDVPPDTVITTSSSSGTSSLVPGTWWYERRDQRDQQPAPEYTSRNPSPYPQPSTPPEKAPVCVHEPQVG